MQDDTPRIDPPGPPEQSGADALVEEWVDAIWDEATTRDTVLVVESHDQLRTAFAAALAEEFYRVLEVSTGEEAVRVAREKQPALVLLDLALDDASGLDVALRLRTHPATRGIAMVALTADPPLQREAARQGLGPVLLMPVPFSELLAAIDRVLDESDHRAGSGGAAPTGSQLRLDLRDEIRSEHLSLATDLPLRVRFEALPQNRRYIEGFQSRLVRAAIPFETVMEGDEIVISMETSIAEAMAIGMGRDVPDEIVFALLDAYPALQQDPEAVQRRVRALEMEYRRLQRIAS